MQSLDNPPQEGMVKIEVWVWTCLRCTHRWLPRDRGHRPKICPECKSPYWDRERLRPLAQGRGLS